MQEEQERNRNTAVRHKALSKWSTLTEFNPVNGWCGYRAGPQLSSLLISDWHGSVVAAYTTQILIISARSASQGQGGINEVYDTLVLGIRLRIGPFTPCLRTKDDYAEQRRILLRP